MSIPRGRNEPEVQVLSGVDGDFPTPHKPKTYCPSTSFRSHDPTIGPIRGWVSE